MSASISLLDERRVADWLAERVSVPSDALSFRRVSTGHSNEMFEVNGPSLHLMLRRPPRVTGDPRASNMEREHRVLRALERTGVPHAEAVAYCDSTDVTGVPFLVMEWVEGFPGRPPLPPAFDDESAVAELSYALVDALVDLRRVDWQAAGLDGFGKPEGFLDRQVARWLGQLKLYQSRSIAHLDEVAGWLSSNMPEARPIALMHGDFAPGNVLFAPQRPGRVAAVVDWEQSTIGDPLLDLGWLLALWTQPDDDDFDGAHSARLSHLPGAPTRGALLRRYEQRWGAPVERLDYYQGLALFKLAVVLEGSYQRHLAGSSDDPYHATLATRVPELIARAHAITAGRWS
jgi:aminoglycoside phosphotransferase (APT) family kinase protein